MMAKIPGHSIGASRAATATAARTIAALFVFVLLFVPSDARASLLSEEAEDKLATFIALFVIFVVPAILIALFWMVHILPEQIAHKRNHPQFEAIRTLCLLSLVFGGLLWPLAWIWAYSKPVLHKLAYGSDTLHAHAANEPHAADPVEASLRDRLARLEGRVPASELTVLRADLEALEAKFVDSQGR